MDICDWFDPKDKLHQEAFDHLNEVGAWPKHFIPQDITFNGNWLYNLTYNMFKYYRDLYKQKKFKKELIEISKLYEQWETDLINCEKAWNTLSGLPQLTRELYDKLIEIQNIRNNILKKMKV